MSNEAIRYEVSIDRLASIGLSVNLLLFIGLLIVSGEGWFPTAGLGFLILCSGMMARARRSPLDLVFVFVVGFITAPSIILLNVFPVVQIFEAGKFSDLLIAEATVQKGVLILCGVVLGWILVQSFVPSRLINDPKRWYQSEETDRVLIYWFMLSIAIRWWAAFSYGVNVAGVESKTTFAAVFYYLAPIDLLAPILAFMLGFGRSGHRERNALLFWLLIAFLAFKVATGWKSAFLHVVLAYGVGLFFFGARIRVIRVTFGILSIVLLYVFAVRPATEIIRTGDVVSHGLYSADGSILSNRLTDSNFQGLWVIQARPNLEGVDIFYFLQDVINQMVPGSIFDAMSFSWLFTQEILGQLDGIESTFAPGIIGTVEMIGGSWAAVFFGAFFRLLVLLFTSVSFRLKRYYILIFVHALLPICIVYLVIDGYSGGFEKLIPGAITFFLFLIIFKSTLIISKKSSMHGSDVEFNRNSDVRIAENMK
jgi:hypothetical protein